MGRDKVLEYVKALAKIRCDRCLDDGAIRLGHQATHTRQLANLRCRTTSARVSHHVDGIERLLPNRFTITVGHFLMGQLLHHGLADLITSAPPDIDHFVVALPDRYQTGGVLLFDFRYLVFSRCDQFMLQIGN